MLATPPQPVGVVKGGPTLAAYLPLRATRRPSSVSAALRSSDFTSTPIRAQPPGKWSPLIRPSHGGPASASAVRQ
jgi:hypothetical protein